MFSINCVKKYKWLELNCPDMRPYHVRLREPNYKKKEFKGSIRWISQLKFNPIAKIQPSYIPWN